MAITRNFVIDCNTTWQMQVFWKKGGKAPPLTGYTGRMYLKRQPTDITAALQMTSANGGVVFDTTQNCIFLNQLPADNKNLTGVYYYDLWIQAPDAINAYRLVQGTITYTPEIDV